MAVFLQISSVKAGKDNNLQIHNKTNDNLVLYVKYSKWNQVGKVLQYTLDMMTNTIVDSIPFQNGTLITLPSGEMFKYGVTNAIHEIYISNKEIASGENLDNKMLKKFKKNASYSAVYFKIEGKSELQNKISVKRGNTTDIYIEKDDYGKYTVVATEPHK